MKEDKDLKLNQRQVRSGGALMDSDASTAGKALIADTTVAAQFNRIKQAATTTATGVVEKSTSAENIAGTDDTVYPSVAGVKEMIDTHATVPIFTQSYTSAEQTISNAGLLTLAHGFGVVPEAIQFFAVCHSAEHNFALNDVIQITTGFGAVKRDATNISIRFWASANPVTAYDFTSGASVALTSASWGFIVKAWA